MTAEPALGLYLHIPFCEAKCTYCNFAIDPRRPAAEREQRYLRALRQELELAEPAPADTLYLGGGTPSLLRAERLAGLIEAARRRFRLAPRAEISLEANPRDLDLAGFHDVRAAGVNRLSLGVQSFDDGVLREMGRLHDANHARTAVERARRAGLASVSLDLILGWPGETRARWRRSLDAVAELELDHVSLYLLEVEGKTLLAHRARRGTLVLPGDDLVADLYRESVELLARLGLRRYEISNFARHGHESRHNAKYWDDSAFLGLGMAAHSYRAGRRFWNLDSFASYCGAIEAGERPQAGERMLAPRERRGDALFTGLRRTSGVDLAAFTVRYGVDPLAEYSEALRVPLEAGLLELAEGRLRLSERGLLLSNEVFQAFV